MPVVEIRPVSDGVQFEFSLCIGTIRTSVTNSIHVVGKVDENDIHIHLMKCMIHDADPKAPPAVILVDTCPGELQQHAYAVARAIAETLRSCGLNTDMVDEVEVWGPRFHQGPWLKVDLRTGEILEEVTYPHPIEQDPATGDLIDILIGKYVDGYSHGIVGFEFCAVNILGSEPRPWKLLTAERSHSLQHQLVDRCHEIRRVRDVGVNQNSVLVEATTSSSTEGDRRLVLKVIAAIVEIYGLKIRNIVVEASSRNTLRWEV